MKITFSPTPFGTVHVGTVVPAEEAVTARRKISAQAGQRGYGRRISVREHRFGSLVRIGAIYPRSKV